MSMNSHVTLSDAEVQGLGVLQNRLVPRLAKDTPTVLEDLAHDIGDSMISSRMECLLILGLFREDQTKLLHFLKVAEKAQILKPATLPTLLLQLGQIDEKALRERNVVNALAA